MTRFIGWLGEVLKDERGAPSSKRIMGLTAGMTLCVTLLAQAFSPFTVEVSEPLVEALMWVCVGGLGLASLDKFSPQAKVNAELHKARESKAIPAVNEETH